MAEAGFAWLAQGGSPALPQHCWQLLLRRPAGLLGSLLYLRGAWSKAASAAASGCAFPFFARLAWLMAWKCERGAWLLQWLARCLQRGACAAAVAAWLVQLARGAAAALGC